MVSVVVVEAALVFLSQRMTIQSYLRIVNVCALMAAGMMGYSCCMHLPCLTQTPSLAWNSLVTSHSPVPEAPFPSHLAETWQ